MVANNPATPSDVASEFWGGGLAAPVGDGDEGFVVGAGELGDAAAEGGVAADGEVGVLPLAVTLMASF